MSANIDKERAAFEAWALTCDGNCSDRNLIKYADDSPFKDEATYANRLVERDWIVWQAARAAPSPAPDADDGFARGMLAELARMGASPAGLSLAAQLFGVGACAGCGFRKLYCRCAAPSPAPIQQAQQGAVVFWDKAVGGFYIAGSQIPDAVKARATPLYTTQQDSCTSPLRAEPAGQIDASALPARRFHHVIRFMDADYVEFAEGSEKGDGVLNGKPYKSNIYSREAAERYVRQGAWREVEIPAEVIAPAGAAKSGDTKPTCRKCPADPNKVCDYCGWQSRVPTVKASQ